MMRYFRLSGEREIENISASALRRELHLETEQEFTGAAEQ
jgi:hypothetical protein